MLANGHSIHSHSPGGPPNPLRIWILSHPRTASNLFCKLFSEHHELQNHESPFLDAYFNGPDAQAAISKDAEGRKEQRERFQHATYQYVLNKLERDIALAEAKVRS